jgi:hypothetical protein
VVFLKNPYSPRPVVRDTLFREEISECRCENKRKHELKSLLARGGFRGLSKSGVCDGNFFVRETLVDGLTTYG